MATVVGCVALSHSPVWSIAPPATPDSPGARFAAAVEQVRGAAVELRPDAVVVFGPDHARNLFYDLMPPFCIGAEKVHSVGDYGTVSGELPLAAGLARAIFDGVTGQGFDPAISLDLGIDHGLTQVYGKLFPALDLPIVPVIVNAGCPPLPSFRRCFDFGRAVGRAIEASADPARVLVVGSGGMSHWPNSISAEDPGITPEWRDFLIHGRPRVNELEPARQSKTRELAESEATGQINPGWDRSLLERVLADPEVMAGLDGEDVETAAGHGAGEVRTWGAAVGAWGGPLAWAAYEPVPSWITGMGVVASFVPQSQDQLEAAAAGMSRA
ncbi:hypothetical protein [Geodermatophilus ruber]|uniref:2,3-dihydroxyphenylpropionate 1,2-dioxygenase n=1 Tax=Geodermatophilus ruber TaxID=504800 RepID=A0A1I4BXW4_9ACTN|nr:hypothetical protein [Geodermatophilus ruber]SFK73658.1 2,3-dihydroxyphenylpropionate 1,2-dioxygenase [Geodermatophilus ruber]